MGQPVGELVGTGAQLLEVAFSLLAVCDGACHLVPDLTVLPGQLGLLELVPGGTGNTDDSSHSGDLGYT